MLAVNEKMSISDLIKIIEWIHTIVQNAVSNIFGEKTIEHSFLTFPSRMLSLNHNKESIYQENASLRR